MAKRRKKTDAAAVARHCLAFELPTKQKMRTNALF